MCVYRGAKRLRRYELMGVIGLLSLAYFFVFLVSLVSQQQMRKFSDAYEKILA